MAHLVAIARRSRSRAPMHLLTSAIVTPEAGVHGDSRGKPGRRQVTVLTQEGWQAACDDLGLTLAWTMRRANLLISGLTLGAEHVGQRLKIGSVELQISYECDPCQRMDEQQPGLTAALTPDWRGGVCCRVLSGGELILNAEVELLPALPAS